MITSVEPVVSETGRYSVTETIKKLGIPRNTLRKNTVRGWIKCGYRKAAAREFYCVSEILRFWRAQL